MSGEISFPPVENGLDYLKSAVEHLRDDPTARDLKYAVLHLSAAVEVLLKVRLMREHWSLVFKDAGKATRPSLRTGKFISIGMEEAVGRLKEIAGVSFSDSALNSFRRLVEVRNKLQHFGISGQDPEVEALAGEVLDALLLFIEENLESGATESEKVLLDEARVLIRDEISRIDALVDARMRRISDELHTNSERIIQCPECQRMTLFLAEEGEPGGKCLFCTNDWTDPEELASDYAGSVLHRTWYEAAKGRDESPTLTCPECSMETLVDRVFTRAQPNDAQWVCFNCTYILAQVAMGQCLKCGTPIIEDEDSMTVCSDCFDYAVGKE